MGQSVKNSFVEFNSDEVAQNILMSKDGKMKGEQFIEETEKNSQKTIDEKNKGGRPKKCGACRKPKTQCTCGRPTVMTGDAIKLLYMAFCMNYSDRQAVLYAGISLQTLYNYQDKTPEFIEHKALLKETTHMYAKANIFKSLVAGDVENSKWLLERLEKDTYGKRDMIETTSSVTIRDPLRERLLAMKEEKRKLAEQEEKANTSQKAVNNSKPKAKKKKFVIVKK